MLIAETSVLQPKDPNAGKPDDWPVFALKDVNVISLAGRHPVSLLAANKRNPVKVTGRLCQFDHDLIHLVKLPNYTDLHIEIPKVILYAFAEYDDGSYGFWAAGEAGWFELETTVSSYKRIFDEMCVGASMLYFLVDKSRRSRKTDFTRTELTKHTERIFKDFCAIGRYPLRFADFEDVQQAFDDHRMFLIASMYEGQEGVDWKETAMMLYYQKKFPEDCERIRSRLLATCAPALDKTNGKNKMKALSSNVSGDAQIKRKRGRPPKAPQLAQGRTPVSHRQNDAVSSSNEEDVDLNITRKRKGILQPQGSKYSKKSRTGMNRRKPVDYTERYAHSLSDDGAANEEKPSRQSPKKESPITAIKTGEELHVITNGVKQELDQNSSPPPEFLPRKFLELQMVELEYSMIPQGPGDLWTCPFEDCHHRVHRASKISGKKSIREHVGAHQQSAQEKINLAVNESRPYLPVNNLVRRLQAIGPVRGQDDGENPVRKFVAPIRRKY